MGVSTQDPESSGTAPCGVVRESAYWPRSSNQSDTFMQAWWNLSHDMVMAGFEAQRVIALRLMKLAQGGPGAAREANQMVAEKMAASSEAMLTLAQGGSPQTVLRRYRTIMRANAKRLSS